MIHFLYQFLMQYYWTPFRRNQILTGGGILLYVREGILYKITKTETDDYYEDFLMEINLRNKTGH